LYKFRALVEWFLVSSERLYESNMSSKNDHYNSDELEAPQWLNAHFFNDVLDGYLKEPGLKVVGVDLSPASAKGDHYASVMFRAKVEYTTTQLKGSSIISLIIKTLPEEDGHKKEMLDTSSVFRTEIAMYTEILPKFEAILRESGDETTFCVPCVYQSLNSNYDTHRVYIILYRRPPHAISLQT